MSEYSRDTLALEEYLRRLNERADAGDVAAERELERWNRLFAHRREKPKGDAA